MTAASDVVVVGCGPVGLTLSMLLAQRDDAVTILERRSEPCRWFTEHKTTTTLERPDFHLNGTATSPAGVAALIAYLRTRLANQPARQESLL
ncbi:MAG TPA: NAD-binding protein [Acidimicrobiales bacterium]